MTTSARKTGEFLFFVAYAILFFFAYFGHLDLFSGAYSLYTNIIAPVILFMAFIININSYTKKEIGCMLLLLLLAIFASTHSGNHLFLKLILIIIPFKFVSINRVVRFDLATRILAFFLMGFLLFTNVAQNTIIYHGASERYNLGFGTPNTTAIFILVAIYDIIFIVRKNIKFKHILLTFGLSSIANLVTDSRATLVASIALSLCLVALLIKPNFFKNKFVKFVITTSIIWSSLIILLLYKLFINNNMFGINANAVLSNRLYNTKLAFDGVSVNFLGHNASTFDYPLDTAVFFVVIGFGILGLLIYITSFTRLFLYLYSKQEYALVIILFSIVVECMNERTMLLVDYNPFMTLFSAFLFSNILGEDAPSQLIRPDQNPALSHSTAEPQV